MAERNAVETWLVGWPVVGGFVAAHSAQDFAAAPVGVGGE
jgi:hypothetical protein